MTGLCIVCALFCGEVPQHAGWSAASARDAAVDRAVARGLRVLARNQEANGAWTAIIGRKVHMSYRGEIGHHVGVTALACMSFMAGGSLPGRGPYGGNVARGLDFILANTLEDGFISAHGSRMYSHGFATLFLAEVYGTTHDPRVKEKLQNAAELIVSAQNGTMGIQKSCTIMLTLATRIANQMPNVPPLMTLNAAAMPSTPSTMAIQPHVVRSPAT